MTPPIEGEVLWLTQGGGRGEKGHEEKKGGQTSIRVLLRAVERQLESWSDD